MKGAPSPLLRENNTIALAEEWFIRRDNLLHQLGTIEFWQVGRQHLRWVVLKQVLNSVHEDRRDLWALWWRDLSDWYGWSCSLRWNW